MSALPPKADIETQLRNVRFVPKVDILRCERGRRTRAAGSGEASRSDQLVGAEDKRLRKSDTERICCLEI